MNAILFPLIATAMNVICQIVAFRFRRGAQYFRSIVEGFLAGAVAFAILEVVFMPGWNSLREYMILALLVDAPIYLALSFLAYSFVQLGQTSIRIRMYAEIAAKPSGMSLEEMNKEYDDKALMRARIQRLIESGDIVKKDGRYFVGRKRFLYIANIVFAAKPILLGRASEFE